MTAYADFTARVVGHWNRLPCDFKGTVDFKNSEG